MRQQSVVVGSELPELKIDCNANERQVLSIEGRGTLESRDLKIKRRKRKVWSWAPKKAQHQDRLADWPTSTSLSAKSRNTIQAHEKHESVLRQFHLLMGLPLLYVIGSIAELVLR
jgi:hypothetical protein